MEMLINEEKEVERTMNICENKQNVDVCHVVIPATELSKVDVSVRCPETGCGEIFTSRSNLGMHLAKKHGTSSALNKKQGTTYYHCPETECKYALKKAFFTRATLLKQHYLKVHAAKEHICGKCCRGFSTAAACNYHSRSCGQGFICSCGTVYKTNEALLTHARRKQHKVIKNPLNSVVDKSKAVMPRSEAVVPVHLLAAVALSELSQPNRKEVTNKPLTREIAVQTDNIDAKLKKKDTVSKNTGCSPNKSRRKTSIQTQTLAPKTSTETQTSGDLLLRKAMLGANIKPTSLEHIQTQTCVKSNKRTHSQTQTLKTNNIKKRKHTETQTIKLNKKLNNKEIIKKSIETQSEIEINNIIEIDKSNELLQNELKTANLTEIDTEISLKEFTPSRLIINDVSLPEMWLNQKSTQTSPSEQQNNNLFNAFRNEDTLDNLLTADERFQTSETQTELANFLKDCDPLCSHIETQTCDELNKSFEEMGSQIEGESFEEMSNMYTQTCDQLFMDFVDIETQTWDDVSASTSQHSQ